jgi:orotidine-5'-phosphate decarboxylase
MPDHPKDKFFLTGLIRKRMTVLTIGLDTDVTKLPPILQGDVLAFNKAIIDATRDVCIAYKPNFAFYESLGTRGWDILEKTIAHIGDQHFIIADAKRGDIGNTSAMYAGAILDHLVCDAVTVNPYMGEDSVKPFLKKGKWVIVLALTSNQGSFDFQQKMLANGRKVYEEVMHTTSTWGTADNMMFVLGATHPSEVKACREMYPDFFFLIPGIGVQGGDLDQVCAAGLNSEGGLLINASRSILYAGQGSDFAEKGHQEAVHLNKMIQPHLSLALDPLKRL